MVRVKNPLSEAVSLVISAVFIGLSIRKMYGYYLRAKKLTGRLCVATEVVNRELE